MKQYPVGVIAVSHVDFYDYAQTVEGPCEPIVPGVVRPPTPLSGVVVTPRADMKLDPDYFEATYRAALARVVKPSTRLNDLRNAALLRIASVKANRKGRKRRQ